MLPKSVDETRDMETLDRSQLYAALTGGHEIPFNLAGRVHPFCEGITQENMDQVYGVVRRFEGNGRQKYSGSLGEIHRAHESGDLEGFRDAIGELFLDFVMD